MGAKETNHHTVISRQELLRQLVGGTLLDELHFVEEIVRHFTGSSLRGCRQHRVAEAIEAAQGERRRNCFNQSSVLQRVKTADDKLVPSLTLIQIVALFSHMASPFVTDTSMQVVPDGRVVA